MKADPTPAVDAPVLPFRPPSTPRWPTSSASRRSTASIRSATASEYGRLSKRTTQTTPEDSEPHSDSWQLCPSSSASCSGSCARCRAHRRPRRSPGDIRPPHPVHPGADRSRRRRDRATKGNARARAGARAACRRGRPSAIQLPQMRRRQRYPLGGHQLRLLAMLRAQERQTPGHGD